MFKVSQYYLKTSFIFSFLQLHLSLNKNGITKKSLLHEINDEIIHKMWLNNLIFFVLNFMMHEAKFPLTYDNEWTKRN